MGCGDGGRSFGLPESPKYKHGVKEKRAASGFLPTPVLAVKAIDRET
jgi:hypothetical protein